MEGREEEKEAELALVDEADFLAGIFTSKPAKDALLPEPWHLPRDDARNGMVYVEQSM